MALIQQLLGVVSAGLFYGAVSSFIRYYAQGSFDIFSPKIKAKLDKYPIAEIVENALLIVFMVMTLVSISMGKRIRNDKVNIILRIVCFILCLFNFFILVAAYYKLFTAEATLSFVVTGIYAFSYVIPPMIFDHQHFLPEICHQIAGTICYLLCIPMYQIVFQIFAYANIHDVTWGNRDEAALTQAAAKALKKPGSKKKEKTKDQKDESAEIKRLWIFMLWLLANLSVGYLLKEFGKRGLNKALEVIAWALIIFQSVKLIFSILYWFRIGLFELDILRRDKRRLELINNNSDPDYMYQDDI